MTQGLAYEIASVIPAVLDSGLLVSLCTIQEPSGNIIEAGVPDGTYVNVSGMVDIPCTAPPPSEARIAATEVKALAEIMSLNIHHVLLGGYYPAIETNTEWRAVIDGIDYDILGAESDSQKQMTRLAVRIATV